MKRISLLILITLISFSLLSGQTIIDIAQNGDFENWTEGLPDHWYGARSSIGTTNVNEYTTSAYSGTTSCQLVRSSTSHARFTTEPLSILADTEYTITYYARGKGDIRNAFYRAGGYSSYSNYTVLDTDEWTEIVWTFEYSTAQDDVEVIFSVINTDAARDHIQIDAVSITYEQPEDPVLYANPNELSGLIYVFDEGPSDAQSFELSGTNLDGTDVTVTAPANFQVSLNETSGFDNDITLTAYDGTATDIWVQLVAGLELGDYTGEAIIGGGGATSTTVAVSGNIIEPFDIPYFNAFRSQDDLDIALAQGFELYDYAIHETTDPYFRFITVGSYIESPDIDFTQYDYLEISFDATTYGGDQGQTLSLMVSADDGASYDLVDSYAITGNYVTYGEILDLTDTYDIATGKIKIEMTGGGASTRFRDFSIDIFETSTPMITADPADLTGTLRYFLGGGPSAAVETVIEVVNVYGNYTTVGSVTLIDESDFEIAKEEESGEGRTEFGSSITIDNVEGDLTFNLLVRMKEGRPVGYYSDEIEITVDNGIDDPLSVIIQVDGEVISMITADPDDLTGELSYIIDVGPSESTECEIETKWDPPPPTGPPPTFPLPEPVPPVVVTVDVIHVDTSVFEVKLPDDEERTEYSSQIVIPVDGDIIFTLLVRMKAGLDIGYYSGSIVISIIDDNGIYGDPLIIPVDGWVLPAGYFVNFEGEGETKPSYDPGTVTLSGLDWDMTQALIGTADGDMKFGNRAARILYDGTTYGSITMLDLKGNGIGEISFYYSRANFSGDRTGIAPLFVVEYTTDARNWTQIGNETNLDGVDELTLFTAEANIPGEARIRIRQTGGDSGKRWNVDNIQITDYEEEPPLPVELSSFTASLIANEVVELQWVTETEINMLGYNVYRNDFNQLGDAVRINPMLITANNSSQQQTYTFIDEEVESGNTYYYWLEIGDLDLTTFFHGPVSIRIIGEDEEGGVPEIPLETKLIGAFPNPFNPDTRIGFSLAEDMRVTITVYNVLGQTMQTLLNDRQYEAGYHTVLWDGTDLSGRPAASGVYFYRMETDNEFEEIKKMMLLK